MVKQKGGNRMKKVGLFFVLIFSSLVLSSCKECTVRVIDWPGKMGTPQENPTYDDGGLRDLERQFPDAIKASSKEDMKNKILEHLRTQKCCLKKLIIMGHGNNGNISTGGGKQDEPCKYINGNRDEWEPILNELKGRFCKGAEIILFGCDVGAGEVGMAKLQELADFFKVSVRAPTRSVRGDENEDSLGEGDWQRAEPSTELRKVKSARNILKEIDKMRPIDPANVLKMAIYDIKTRPMLKKPEEIIFNIEDPELIQQLISSIDFKKSYDGNLLLSKYSAYVYLQLKDGTIEQYYLTLDWAYFEQYIDGSHILYSISPDGIALFKKNAIKK